MLKYITVIPLVILAFFTGYFVRGLFLHTGLFRTLNYSNSTYDVKLSFPSGEERIFTLEPKEFIDISVKNTGEGSIKVLLNNDTEENIGYVTHFNNPIMISIDSQNQITFDYLTENNP